MTVSHAPVRWPLCHKPGNSTRAGFHSTVLVTIAAALCLFARTATQAQSRASYDAARMRMVEDAVRGAGVTDVRVLNAIRATPRHEFVAAPLRKQAYYDMALPIGFHQTISSPFIVAYMTQSLKPRPTDRVLEIGTGSGYQAAVLSPLVKEVYTIEIIESLGEKAAHTLRRLGYKNIFSRMGDGFKGWPEQAPFDKIMVTCSPEKPPQPLIDQLREGGLLVIPVGQRYQQTLYIMRKQGGKLIAEALRPTLFVPMTGVAEDRREIQPDPANPTAVNGDFEITPGENGFVPGWYYQRQLTWVTDPRAPDGRHFVTLRNQEPGRAAHLLQGFPIDGRLVGHVELSAWVRYADTVDPPRSGDFPCLAVTLYDENRKDLGTQWIGPFRGTADWQPYQDRFRIPPAAREGILRIGLFGASGQISFDGVQMKPVPR
ncbi:MAG: protein-L-isoaspartate(D-aspartate) O-methyltransferase [Pirellulaceae bacterium]